MNKNNSQQCSAVVVAAGIGQRMGQPIPKQYLSLAGATVLSHSLRPLLAHSRITDVWVVLHPQDVWFTALPEATHPKIQVVNGGKERVDSVLAGLQQVEQPWTLVHDAARPCLCPQDLQRLLDEVPAQGGLLATQVVDTLKYSEDGVTSSHTVSRDALWHALTPQLFPTAALRCAIEAALARGDAITDEASAMELAGIQPQLIVGRRDNLKLTTPDDLIFAEWILTQRNSRKC